MRLTGLHKCRPWASAPSPDKLMVFGGIISMACWGDLAFLRFHLCIHELRMHWVA